MHNVPDYVPEVYLIHRNGDRWAYKNITQAAKKLYKLGYWGYWMRDSHIGTNFDEFVGFSWRIGLPHAEQDFYTYRHYDYILRTDLGDIVTVDDLKETIRTKRPAYYRWRKIEGKDFQFRQGPVPNTRKYRGGGHYYRRVRTTNERRQTVGMERDEDVLEYGVKLRPKRNSNNIPDSWDDYAYANQPYKNWKRYRKTQWK